jgi:hypothetical protein
VNTQRSHRGLVLALILVGYLLILLDVSILMAALPRIHRDLGFSATGLSWVQNAYTLAFGGLLLLGARAGDLLGRRRMFVVSPRRQRLQPPAGRARVPAADGRRLRGSGDHSEARPASEQCPPAA